MEIITVKSLEYLKQRHAAQTYLSQQASIKVSDVYESQISHSFMVFDKEGKKTITFWQYLKPINSIDEFPKSRIGIKSLIY